MRWSVTLLALFVAVGAACSSSPPSAESDGGPDAGPDAGLDAGQDAGPDAGSDAGPDAGPDAGVDAGQDAGPPPGATLGADIYGVICDRLGAELLPEDPTAASWEPICHNLGAGYAASVDVGALPTSVDAGALALPIARLNALAVQRPTIVAAADALFPNAPIDGGGFQGALLDFALDAGALYGTGADPWTPAADGLGALLPLPPGSSALLAESTISGRAGYLPTAAQGGLTAILARDPNLPQIALGLPAVLSGADAGTASFDDVLNGVQYTLATQAPTESALTPLTITTATDQPSRPRSWREWIAALLVTDPAYTVDGGTSAWIVQRDSRGQALVLADAGGFFFSLGGVALVDSFDEFLAADGGVVAETPFAARGEDAGAPRTIDDAGRSLPLAFSYLDLSGTAFGAVGRDLVALDDPTSSDGGLESEGEALFDSVAGLGLLAGPRAEVPFPAALGTYLSYNADLSPLPDLAHAVGQVVADSRSDEIFLALEDLIDNHADLLARLVSNLYAIQTIAQTHAGLADAGLEAPAQLAANLPLWDQLTAPLGDLAEHSGAVASLVAQVGAPALVTPQADANHLGNALALLLRYADRFDYPPNGTHYDGSAGGPTNPGGINGPPVNLSTDATGNTVGPPQLLVSRTSPLATPNLSLAERSLQLLADLNGGPACNRSGASASLRVGGISSSWPLSGGDGQCDLIKFAPNLGAYLVDALLPSTHPKRSELTFTDTGFSDLINTLAGESGESPDQIYAASSDLAGFTSHPTPVALDRFFFFGASTTAYPGMPDADPANQGTQVDKFISDLFDPVSILQCPANGNGVPTCSPDAQTLRVHDRGAVFALEQVALGDFVAPLVLAAADVACSGSTCNLAEFTGETDDLQALQVLAYHWPGADHGTECTVGPLGSVAGCSGAGLNSNEPTLADVLDGDLVPAVNALANTLAQIEQLTLARGPNAGTTVTGAQVVEAVTQILFDPTYAATVGMTDRHGNATTTWPDGVTQGHVTGFTLFRDAFDGFNTVFQQSLSVDAADRQSRWYRARSLWVDQLFAVQGSGAGATFKNPTTLPLLRLGLELLRQQVNAQCPTREQGDGCAWGQTGIGAWAETTLAGPLFASALDFLELVRSNNGLRRSFEATFNDGLSGLAPLLSWMADWIDAEAHDVDYVAQRQALAPAFSPAFSSAGPGAVRLGVSALAEVEALDAHGIWPGVAARLFGDQTGDGAAPAVDTFRTALLSVQRAVPGASGPPTAPDLSDVRANQGAYWSGNTQEWRTLASLLERRGVLP